MHLHVIVTVSFLSTAPRILVTLNPVSVSIQTNVMTVSSNTLFSSSRIAISNKTKGPPAWGLGEGLTTPHRKKDTYYEM